MSDISVGWLDVREPWDSHARAGAIAALVTKWAKERVGTSDKALRVLDLGCGTGANFRAVSPLLGPRQEWVLLDRQSDLIAEARRRVQSTPLIRVSFDQKLLPNIDPETLVVGRDLVTCSSLLELVSKEWLERLWASVQRHRVAFLTTLDYDGRINFLPANGTDLALRELMNRHQRRDCGYGPALGADATAELVRLARTSGAYRLHAPSDWRIEPARDHTWQPLIAGLSQAAGEQAAGEQAAGEQAAADQVVSPQHDFDAWRDDRLEGEWYRLTIGHQDMFAAWI